MKQELFSDRLRGYFASETTLADIAPDAWQQMVATAAGHRQRRGIYRLCDMSLTPPVGRMATASVAAVAVAAVAGGISLTVLKPWQDEAPAADMRLFGPPGAQGPRSVPGPVGMPTPRYFESDWSVASPSYLPGDAVTVQLKLTNSWDRPVSLDGALPPSVLNFVDSPEPDELSLGRTVLSDDRRQIEPGKEVTLSILIGPEITSTLPIGRFSLYQEVRFIRGDSDDPLSTTTLVLNSGPLFVIVPPEGALEKAVQVNQSQQSGDVIMNLESVNFSALETKIVVTASFPDAWLTEESTQNDLFAPIPTAVAPPPAVTKSPPQPDSLTAPTPAPTATAAPMPQVPYGQRFVQSAVAEYRIDGGEWQELALYRYDGPAEAVHIEWTMGLVSSEARLFEFAITGVQDSPDGETTGRWEWSVPLQEG